MANTALQRTGQLLLTNKSGGAVAQGDVVIVDTANAAAFTTTTTSGYVSGTPGVVLEPNGIANNAIGMVAIQGYVPVVNLSGTGSIGDLIKTHTVAKQGVRHAAAAVAGDFGQVLGTSATPAAILWGSVNLSAGAGSDTNAIHVNVSAEINGITEKTTPVAADLLVIEDSAAANVKKKVQVSNLPLGFGVLTDYSATSTVVGWGSFTKKQIYYQKIGKLVFVAYSLAGASNSATTTFTLPDACPAAPDQNFITYAVDNGTTAVAAIGYVTPGSNVVVMTKNMPGAAFTNTGTKSSVATFVYSAA